MKKKFALKLAYVLLVATLLTTSIVSGTFAKYTTSDSASDIARVAKWGVTAEVSGNLFGKDYASNAAAADQNSIVAATSTNVSASANVVAPGTKNETGLTVEIAGTPEVAYTIAVDANGQTVEDIFLAAGTYGVMVEATGLNAATDVTAYYTLSGSTYTAATGSWASSTTYYELIDTVTLSSAYYPIVWTVTATGNATAISTTSNLTAIATAMQTGIAAGTHNANSNSAASYTLTWEWPFSTNDGADTILGDLQAGSAVVKLDGTTYTTPTDGTDYNLDVVFGMKVTVTQVD